MDIWDRDRGAGSWSPTFLRPLNDWEIEEAARFLHTLYEVIYCPSGEDKLLLKNDKEKGFSVKSMHKGFDPSPAIDFPSSDLESRCSSKNWSFCFGSYLGQSTHLGPTQTPWNDFGK